MASQAEKDRARQFVTENLQGRGKGYYWPKVEEQLVAAGLIQRVVNPDSIWQSAANICGMASFIHELVEQDPVQYVWLGIWLFKMAKGRLGRGKDSIQISVSIETRQSPIPARMDHADWVVLASLRDYSNKVLKYAYNAKIPILADIPILGILGQSWVAEPIAGINWPGDIETLLRAAGFKRIVNAANTSRLAGYDNLHRAGEYFEAGYHVMLLINTAMLDGGDTKPTADHWVTLESPIDENMWAFHSATQTQGLAFTIFDPAKRQRYRVPQPPAQYLVMQRVINHYYGFMAAHV